MAELEACQKCGQPNEAEGDHWCCECRDGGFIRSEGKVNPCVCKLTGVSESEFIRRSGIGLYAGTMAKYTLKTWPGSDDARAKAFEFVETWPPKKHLMFLSGNVGTGKTGLGTAVMRELWLKHKLVGRFIPSVALLKRYRASFDEDSRFETPEDIHREMDRAALVVLDDFGTESPTAFAMQEMFALINDRHSAGKPLIVTTNKTLTEMDQRIKSRLMDAERSVVVEFHGADRRAK